MSYASPPQKCSLKLEPFTVAVPQAELDDLKKLVQLAPLAKKTYENTQTKHNFGVTREWAANAQQEWLSFDWRKQEERINQIPQFHAVVKGQDGHDYKIHFSALFSQKPDAIPIIFSHGWPGCFLEFLPMMEHIKATLKPEELPYHIIAPSLPGYGFSDQAPLETDLDVYQVAYLFDSLMNGLGFDKYVAQGGDIGSYITWRLAKEHDSCVAAHVNFKRLAVTAKPPEGSPEREEYDRTGGPTPLDMLTGFQNFAYAMEHGTRPSTIGLVLSSSPIALLAWIGEKYVQWSDESPSLETILTFTTLYWLTNSFPSSIWNYRETNGHKAVDDPDKVEVDQMHWVSAPIGYSDFKCEMVHTPVHLMKSLCNLVYNKEHSSGGHFAALEKPEILWADVQEFVKVAWGQPRKAKGE